MTSRQRPAVAVEGAVAWKCTHPSLHNKTAGLSCFLTIFTNPIICLVAAEFSSPGAHLESGWHLANPSLQGLHPGMGLHAGEQGACQSLSHFKWDLTPIMGAHGVTWEKEQGDGEENWLMWRGCVCRRDPCRRRWMRANSLLWLGSRTCCWQRQWFSTGPRTCELSRRWDVHHAHIFSNLFHFIHSFSVSRFLQQSVWPGEAVVKVLEDLQAAWRWGRVTNLLTAMELVLWTLMQQKPDKVIKIKIKSFLHFQECRTTLQANKCIGPRCGPIGRFLQHGSCTVLAGYHTAAVAPVEAEDKEDWWVIHS